MPRNLPHWPDHNRGLALSNDLVFKTLFGRAPHLLSDLVNAVRHHAAPIELVRVLNPTILPSELQGKQVVLDVLAQDANGWRYAVEMQWRRYLHWPERNVFYLSRSLAGQLRKGEDYRLLKPVIGISLLGQDLFRLRPEQADWFFSLRDARNPEVEATQSLQLHIIELRKAERLQGLPPALSAWVACLLHNLDKDAMSRIHHPPVREALRHLDALCSDEQLRMAAERRQQALIDEQDALDLARLEGQAEGQAALLHALLAHRFGPLPPSLQTTLRSAGSTQLQAWALKSLQARTLDEVLG
ncbi:Rpn family recombination-promoting nuclease/putative transposase [Orrella sp. JC864]|uniref:Rpn family recombination-promoting nuclease/putative transposase n=1 Tax=Orrella sp. JC864 TaxID=3120298 RepID=UPI00300B7BDC